MNSVYLRPMLISDYQAVFSLWLATEGMELIEDDNEAGIALYLQRNPCTCLVAEFQGEIVGSLLCGHDGRRAILRHLAIRNDFRGQGIARQLVETCMDALTAEGIRRCNLFVLDNNPTGAAFWAYLGWLKLPDNYQTLQRMV
nr:GNAT family N-acetyltransferase [uncultured Deefgea sp.]